MILVVDDDRSILRLLGRLLEREGFQVLTAHDGEEALTLAEEHHPDLVLSDVSMPKLDGVQLAQELRERQGNDRPKLVLMSAFNGAGADVADAFIPKPFDVSH